MTFNILITNQPVVAHSSLFFIYEDEQLKIGCLKELKSNNNGVGITLEYFPVTYSYLNDILDTYIEYWNCSNNILKQSYIKAIMNCVSEDKVPQEVTNLLNKYNIQIKYLNKENYDWSHSDLVKNYKDWDVIIDTIN